MVEWRMTLVLVLIAIMLRLNFKLVGVFLWGAMRSKDIVSKNQLLAPRTYYRHSIVLAYFQLSATVTFHVSLCLPLGRKILKESSHMPSVFISSSSPSKWTLSFVRYWLKIAWKIHKNFLFCSYNCSLTGTLQSRLSFLLVVWTYITHQQLIRTSIEMTRLTSSQKHVL